METTGKVSKSFQKFPLASTSLMTLFYRQYRDLNDVDRKASFQKFPCEFPSFSFLSFHKVSMKVSIFGVPETEPQAG